MAVDNPDEVPEDLSVRGAIKAAMAEHMPPDPEVPETPAPTEPVEPEPKEGRERDDQGRFTKQEQKQETKRETLSLKEKGRSGDAAGGADGNSISIKPPEGWSAAAKAEFGKLPPVVQQEVIRREKETHQAITRQDEDRVLGKQVREHSQPYMATILAEGATPALTYQEFLKTAYALRTASPYQKQQMLLNLAQQFNVPLQGLNAAAPAQVHPELLALRQELDGLKQARQLEIQQRQQMENSSLASHIEAFAQEPGHEHFETLRPHMSALLTSGAAQTLQEAYDQALWASSDLRSTLLETELAKRSSPQKPNPAVAARRAAVSVTGAPGAINGINGASDPNRSLRDELRANLRSAQGRV